MMDIVICLITNIVRIYLINRFAELFAGKKDYKRKERLVASILFWIVNSLLFLFFHTAWINILSNLIGISTIVFFLTKSVKANVFITLIIYFILAACDVLGTASFIHYRDGEMHSQIYAIIALFLSFICELVCERLIKNRNEIDRTQNLALILVPFFSIAIIVALMYSESDTDLGIVLVSVGLLIINFLMLYLYNLLLRSMSLKYEAELWKQQTEVYAHQIEVIKQEENKIREFRHDMKHHINEIKILANSQKLEPLVEYTDKMSACLENPEEIVSSGNRETDSVLNYLLQKAKKELNTVEVKVLLPEDLKHSFDVNVIIGNLLENAMEGAVSTEEKYLNVAMVYQKGVLKIEVENSYLPQNVTEKGNRLFVSGKKEKENHGIGLESVRKIVEKHNGSMEIKRDELQFSVHIILYMD